MAILFTDGFDLYGTATGTNVYTRGWQIAGGSGGTPSSTITPYGAGQSLQIASSWTPGLHITHTTVGTAATTVGFAFRTTAFLGTPGTAGTHIVALVSGGLNGTYMIGLQINNDGSIQVNRQTAYNTGVSLGFSSPGILKINTWYYLELSVSISDTVGTARVDVDGQTVLNLTNVDTRNGAPTTVDTLFLSSFNSSSIQCNFDDLYITDSATPLGPRRIHTLRPEADTAQKQWTSTAGWQPTKTTSVETSGYPTRGNIFTANANTAIKGVQVYFGALAQTVVLGIAELSSLNPGAVSTILYQSNSVSRSAAGYETFSFSDVTITSGKVYAVYITRTDSTSSAPSHLAYSATLDNVDPTGFLTLSAYIFKQDNNIIVGDTLYGAVGGGYNMILNYSGANNYLAVYDPYSNDGDASYVSASTVGDYDLYDIANLPATANTISAVNHLVWARKSDANTRTITQTIKSGANTTDSAALTLAASFTGFSKIYETNPNTSSTWTQSDVNTLQIGQKVAS